MTACIIHTLTRTRSLTVALLLIAATVRADGRYQAIPIDPGQGYGADKALIVDTVSGHLWIWIESPSVDEDPGGRFLIYQGQLVPGKQMGDIIDKQEWPARPPSKEGKDGKDTKGLHDFGRVLRE